MLGILKLTVTQQSARSDRLWLTGHYARLKDGVKAFAADVEDVCNCFTAAAKNRRGEFGDKLQVSRATCIHRRSAVISKFMFQIHPRWQGAMK